MRLNGESVRGFRVVVTKAIILEGSAPPSSSCKRDIGVCSSSTIVVLGAWAFVPMMLILRRLFCRVSGIPSISYQGCGIPIISGWRSLYCR